MSCQDLQAGGPWRSQGAPGVFFQSLESTLGPCLESQGGLGEPCDVPRRSLGSLGGPLGDPWEARGGALAVLGVPWEFLGWSLVALPSLLGALADHENRSKTISFFFGFRPLGVPEELYEDSWKRMERS